MMIKKKKKSISSDLRAILYLVNPHSAEPKGSWGGALGSTFLLAQSPSSCRVTLAGPSADDVWI